MEKALGRIDQVLGPLPNPEEIREEMRYIKEEMRGISPSTGASMPEEVKKRKTVEEILKEEEDEAMKGR